MNWEVLLKKLCIQNVVNSSKDTRQLIFPMVPLKKKKKREKIKKRKKEVEIACVRKPVKIKGIQFLPYRALTLGSNGFKSTKG